MADRPRFNSADPPEPTTSLDNFKSIRWTVRSKISDYPQFNSTKPPEATTHLDKFLISTADCPALLGGPSVVYSANSTKGDNVSGQNSRLYGGLSALQKRTVRSSILRKHQRQHHLWTTSKSTCILSGPPRRTVCDSYLLTPRAATSEAGVAPRRAVPADGGPTDGEASTTPSTGRVAHGHG